MSPARQITSALALTFLVLGVLGLIGLALGVFGPLFR
jgi:hypothetical protein